MPGSVTGPFCRCRPVERRTRSITSRRASGDERVDVPTEAGHTGLLPGSAQHDDEHGHDDHDDGDERPRSRADATAVAMTRHGIAPRWAPSRRTTGTWAPVPQSVPSAQISCFQIGALAFRASMPKRAASNASARCGARRRPPPRTRRARADRCGAAGRCGRCRPLARISAAMAAKRGTHLRLVRLVDELHHVGAHPLSRRGRARCRRRAPRRRTTAARPVVGGAHGQRLRGERQPVVAVDRRLHNAHRSRARARCDEGRVTAGQAPRRHSRSAPSLACAIVDRSEAKRRRAVPHRAVPRTSGVAPSVRARATGLGAPASRRSPSGAVCRRATGVIGGVLALAVLWTMLPTHAGRSAGVSVRSTVATERRSASCHRRRGRAHHPAAAPARRPPPHHHAAPSRCRPAPTPAAAGVHHAHAAATYAVTVGTRSSPSPSPWR